LDTFCDQSPKVQVRDGLFYLPNTEKPYSGENICVYLSNGQYYSQGEMKKGLRHGTWTFWYENGQKWYEGNYKEGIEIGEGGSIITRYENGQIKSEENYKDGKLDGKSIEWYENGQIKLEGNYKDDKSVGKVTMWHENGQKKVEANYKDGKKDGIWTTWYENGQKMSEENYKDGELDGKQTKWYKNGHLESERTYKDGELDSVWINWSVDELIAKGEASYHANCSGCHQKDGSGIPGVFPALKGSSVVNGPFTYYLNIVNNGKGGMPAFKMLGDNDLASVIFYVKRAFGNNGSVVQPSDVKVETN
jgi:antitoxin component YwqK of YwqJK toxin-antitoxin module